MPQQLHLLGHFFYTMEILNIDESHELERCEVVIKQGLNTFIEVGEALFLIRDKRLYRREFKTFEDYCQQKWSMPRQHVNRMISGYKIVNHLEPMGSILPESERQVRPLVGLEKDVQIAVWNDVVHESIIDNKKITAKMVEHKAEEYKEINQIISGIEKYPYVCN